MPLPDASRLLALPPGSWRALGARLREAGLTQNSAAPFSRLMTGLPERSREPVLRWNVRRLETPSGLAMRLFLHRDPIPLPSARKPLAPLELEPYVNAGFLVMAEAESVAFPYRMNLFNDLLIVTDDLLLGGDAVMGAGVTTGDICNAAYPLRPIQRALDLGCGAGTAALLFAARAKEVVGTDINPRAIVLSKLNAHLNGIVNVDFRLGDLFEPIGDERFDLIVSQPPFVPMSDDDERATYLHGGPRGDEMALRILREAPRQLVPTGRAVFLIEWPVLDGVSIEARVRDAVASDELNVFLLRDSGVGADAFTAGYSAARHPTLGREFDLAAETLRTHLDRLGIREFRFTIVVLERPNGPRGWTATVDIRALAVVKVTSGRIESLMAARQLAAADAETLLSATLRVPEGTVFAEERTSPELDAAPVVRVRFTDDALLPELQLNDHSLRLVRLLHGGDDVRAAVLRFAELYNVAYLDACGKVLPAVREALKMGILEAG